MCGIIGYIGHRPAVPVVMEGLSRLEYRGYDSAGIAWMMQNKLEIARVEGKLQALENKLAKMPPVFSTCAMGHTRWATHGAPVERNAHPHMSNDQSIAIVHNGIIENYQAIKNELLERGYIFHSETDTEVLVNLIAEMRKTEPDMTHAFAAALRKAKGAYALCMLSVDEPGVIYAARVSAPLLIGIGTGENFVASDIPAFLPYTREVIFLEEGDMARLTISERQIYKIVDLAPVQRSPQVIQWSMQAAQKDGYKHFMLKEIFEQPRVIRDCLAGRLHQDNEQINLPELDKSSVPDRIHIIACGTSYHSGLWARHIIESIAQIPVQVEIASEFRYRETLLFGLNDLAIFISQSGETADTLAALRDVKKHGVFTLGLCNVLGSSIAREADAVIFTQAGPEISVASTKAMTSQMLALSIMALYWGKRKGILHPQTQKEITAQLFSLPNILDENLPAMHKKAADLARDYANFADFFYLGRGFCFPLALEGALKLKELSYIHAEGYAAGEMKHGPIALIDPQFPTFAIALNNPLLSKIKSNIAEVKSRAGKVIALTDAAVELDADDIWLIPEIPSQISSFLILPALQLFSYEVADYLGKDVDQPRNLAKSVTVE